MMSFKQKKKLKLNMNEIENDKQLQSIYYFNLYAGVLHLILAVVVLVMANTVTIPYNARVSTILKVTETSELNEAFLTPECNGILYTNFFKWTDCIENNGIYLPDENGPAFAPKEKLLFKLHSWPLIFIYELFTSFSHFFCFFFNEMYEKLLLKKLAPFRWLEYSITSSLMTVIILQLSGVANIFILLGFFVLNSFMCLLGGFGTELLETTRNFVFESFPNFYKILKTYFLFLSWTSFILIYSLVFVALDQSINPLFKTQAEKLWRDLYEFVVILDVLLFVFYFTFPAIQAFQMYKNRLSSYLFCEKLFIIASFVTKTILTLTVLISATLRDD